MKRTMWPFLISAALMLVPLRPALAATFVAPAGGLTVKALHLRKDGWAMVTFVESVSQLNGCAPYVYDTTYTQPVWIEIGTTETGKQLYASLLVASVVGRKIMSVGFEFNANGECYLHNLRLEP
jgi:hypothetical protein